MDPNIEVKNLSFAFSDENWVFQDVNFSIFPGDIIGIVGPSGSGKTTLCYILKGIIPHALKGNLKGDISVCSLNTRKTRIAKLANQIGMVYQDINTQLFANSVKEEIQFGLNNLNLDPEFAEDAIQALDLQEIVHKSPMNLSMGQKQRVVLASIIAMHPKVLILDEPSVHLDPSNKNDLLKWLKLLHDEWNMTILIASNDPWLIGNICGSLLHFVDGKLIRKKKSDLLEFGTTWTWRI